MAEDGKQRESEKLQRLIEELTAAGAGTRKYKNREYTLDGLVNLYQKLNPNEDQPWWKDALNAVGRTLGDVFGESTEDRTKRREREFLAAQDVLKVLSGQPVAGRDSSFADDVLRAWGDRPKEAAARFDAARIALQEADPQNKLLPAISREQAARDASAAYRREVAVGGVGAARGQAAQAERLAGMAEAGVAGVPGGRTTTPGAKPPVAKPAVAPAEWIETQLELQGLPDTPENRKALQAQYKKQGAMVWNDQMQQDFVTRYPQYAYLFDAEVFGDSADLVKNIIVRAVNEKWFLYPETAKTMIKRMVAATPYGMRSTDAQESFDSLGLAEQNAKVDAKVRELKGLYGNLGLTDDVWKELGRTASRNSLEEAGTRANLFKTIYETTPEGAMRYQNAVKVLETGRLGQDVRKVYRDYMFNSSDANVSSDIQAYTTGTKTLDDIRRERQVLARGAFPALVDIMDQGLTPKQVADQYAAYASDILELPVQSIDMMTSLYRKAFEGPKLMSIGEWQKMLRADPNYGWQYTSTANKQAMDIATSIARAFGAVK